MYCNIRPVRQEFLVASTVIPRMFNKSIQAVCDIKFRVMASGNVKLLIYRFQVSDRGTESVMLCSIYSKSF